MENISLKFILLITAMTILCKGSAGFQDRSSRFFSGGGFRYPAAPPLNPMDQGLPDLNERTRYRSEAV
uniref:Putative secreted protein n=1 Tax=Triatoma dimidiata TaxID=72491 RepID=A0A0V0GFP8_TRIDM